MNLSKAQANVLEAIREQTTFQRGPRKGQPKRAIDCACYYANTVYALERRGLIRFVDNVLGTGYVATEVK